MQSLEEKSNQQYLKLREILNDLKKKLPEKTPESWKEELDQ